jgi:hypothetical protein
VTEPPDKAFGLSWFAGIASALVIAVVIWGVSAILGPDGPCGGDPAALKDASAEATSAGTSRMTIRAMVAGGAAKALGVFDYRRRLGRVEIDRRPERNEVVVYDEDRTYVRHPGIRRGRWQVYTDENAGFQGGLGNLSIASDPSRQLEYLNDLTDVQEVGDERMFGVCTTRYVGTVRLVPELPVVPRNASPGLRRRIEGFRRDATRRAEGATGTIQAWIGADGLVWHLELTRLVPNSPSYSLRFSIDFYDYGEVAVHVRVPRHADPISLDQLLKSRRR